MQNTAPAYFGRYQVLEELGSGAMGVVYLCVDPRLARPVAVKVLKESEFMTPQELEQFHGRFRHEAEAAGRMNHPGIVQIFDIGPSYIVMEFLEGKPLNGVLRSGAALSVKQIASLVSQVSDAVDYAHRHGIVHRDIKPANIMLLDDGGVKVLDFGVARLESSNLTAVGTVVGSVRYMAPEQMMGERVDGRADVFSVAAVAYELLTGRAPFPGKSITEVVARVVHGSHVPPREVDARLPEALNGVFAKAFAPRPERRYSQALEFSRELQGALQPIQDLAIAHRGDEHSSARTESQATTVKGPAPVPPGTTVRGAVVAGMAPPPRPGPPPTVPVATPDSSLAATTIVPPAPSAAHLAATTIAPPTAVLHREGVLILDSDPPGAAVFVDSKPVGKAPLESVDASFGRHLVRMELGGRETMSATIELRPERPLKVVMFTLPPPGLGSGTVRPGQLVSFGPDVQPPVRISGPVPGYPETVRQRGLEGTPVAELWISETGEVFNTAIVESAGKLLDKALLAAVSRWRFSPAMLRGVPVSVRITVQHHFRR